MGFVHCTRCDFEQDDFWNESYNPIKSQVSWWEEIISQAIDKENPQREKIVDRNLAMSIGMPFGINDKGEAVVDVRDFFSKELENIAKRIQRMHWLTEADYMNDDNKTCPVCGSSLTVD